MLGRLSRRLSLSCCRGVSIVVPLCDLHGLFPYKIHVFQEKKKKEAKQGEQKDHKTELLKEIQNMGCGQGVSVCCESVTIGNKGILSRLVLCGV